jgi:hypothetical protein
MNFGLQLLTAVRWPVQRYNGSQRPRRKDSRLLPAEVAAVACSSTPSPASGREAKPRLVIANWKGRDSPTPCTTHAVTHATWIEATSEHLSYQMDLKSDRMSHWAGIHVLYRGILMGPKHHGPPAVALAALPMRRACSHPPLSDSSPFVSSCCALVLPPHR